MQCPDARYRVGRRDDRGSRNEFEDQRRLAIGRHVSERACVERRRVGSIFRAMHGPFEPREIGEIGQLAHVFEACDEDAECIAVVAQIAAERRRRLPIGARQRIEEFAADDFANDRRGAAERLVADAIELAR